jgi:hypothetical protein
MVDGRWSMVDGRWSMVDGRWSMVDGAKHKNRPILLKNRFSIDDQNLPRHAAGMTGGGSVDLSFGTDVGRPRSLTSAVQERLRADILATRLLPGQKLHIAGLAKQFSVSLAAVREALSRLVADGLVLASDQRGFRVSPVSLADLADVTQTRIDIEGLALRRSMIPAFTTKSGCSVTVSFIARWSAPAARNGCSAFAMCCTSRASAIVACRSGARLGSRATSMPSTPQSSMPCAGAMRMLR